VGPTVVINSLRLSASNIPSLYSELQLQDDKGFVESVISIRIPFTDFLAGIHIAAASTRKNSIFLFETYSQPS
jgi:hypothetical protein